MAEPKWADGAFLDAMRQEADPLADGVVQALFNELGPEGVMAFHGGLIRRDGVPAESLPASLQQVVESYIDESSRLPGWADPQQIERAEEVLRSYGLVAYTILACASLPECYVDWRGVPVLYMSQRLTEHVHRRVVETSQFTMGVMSQDGLGAGGSGVIAAQKVRLMHASMRRLILLEPPEQAAQENLPDIASVFRHANWMAELGAPINQEDMAFTLQTFAWVIVRGMRTLDCRLSPADEEAIIHVWNVAGHIMGIRPELMPSSVSEAEQLFLKLKTRLAGPSQEGQALMAALLEFLHKASPLRYLPETLIRDLIGDGTADLLAIPTLSVKERRQAEKWVGRIEEVNHLESGVLRGLPFLRAGAELLFDDLLDHLLRLPRGGERHLFELPTHLGMAWRRGAVAAGA